MSNQPEFLFITPPFTQLNTPYPATAYLKGYFNTIGHTVRQADLGINVTLRIFSKDGLTQLFHRIENASFTLSADNQQKILLKSSYIRTIDPVIRFLQGNNPNLANHICSRKYLPENRRFSQLEGLEWSFGDSGIHDLARHLATLYLEDLGDLIIDTIDPHFGFSRYAEKLALAAPSFTPLLEALNAPDSLIDQFLFEELEKEIAQHQPKHIGLSVPFPGNVYGAFKIGQYVKKHYPKMKVVMGGGYPNTELRKLSDVRVFDFVDYITLDDGEQPLTQLITHFQNPSNYTNLVRTLTLKQGHVHQFHNPQILDIPHAKVGHPDYSDLPLNKYISVIEMANPMHRLWSEGRWNKLTLAHGCYWGKCTFCDIHLDYIGRYEPVTAQILCDRIENVIQETDETGFHFVDEAAPPALLKELSLEILKRNLNVVWWTNIRFEKSFTYDLCQLMKKAGCIAVSGGLEVASDRLLKLIKKGVSIQQVTGVTSNLSRSGIMVHAYLMYGFPTQTAQETMDSLEVVRQLFESKIIQSGYWHLFSMTAHSPVGKNPDLFNTKIVSGLDHEFAINDLIHEDPKGTHHTQFSKGLKTALQNYMNYTGFDVPLNNWFEHRTPKTTIPNQLISGYITLNEFTEISLNKTSLNTGFKLIKTDKTKDKILLQVTHNTGKNTFKIKEDKANWLLQIIQNSSIESIDKPKYQFIKDSYEETFKEPFILFWSSNLVQYLRSSGWIFI